MKQIKFLDTDNDVIHGGIMLDNGDVICGCCGSIIPSDEQRPELGFKLLEEYDTWTSLDEAIIGD